MESYIKKKTLLYGLTAFLFAVIAISVVYTVGIFLLQNEFPPPVSTTSSDFLSTFTSYEDVRTFLTANSKNQGLFPFFGPWDVVQLPLLDAAFKSLNAETSSPGLVIDHSTTNIQVEGVDEADIVKTDGVYTYMLSESSLYIVKVYPPPTAEVVANITFSDLHPVGLFVNGDRMLVLGSKYFIPSNNVYGYYIVDIKTFVQIYDISDRTNPVLLHDLTLTGSYFNSRMIDDYVYFVVSQPAYVIYDTAILPKIYSNGKLVKEIVPSEIHYSNGSDNYYQYTTLVALNMLDVSEAPTYMTLMLGATSSMYVSPKNMYITFPEKDGNITICRVYIQEQNIRVEAKGQVLGRELNQFSMDEYNDYFRIATETWISGVPRSNLFILDMNMSIVSKLLDIEVGETLDSARFIGNRCYLSTSIVRRDPFFVINVENAETPQILGYLKIPGFTRYLHPYDENHLIGVGRDEFNNIQVSLFNVTDVNAPEKISGYIFQGEWSDTPVLTDHKALLFSYEKDLSAFPVSIYYYNNQYLLQQGLFVFNLTLSNGFVLRGNITHYENGLNDWDGSYYVKRAFYIENVLYTVSEKKIKMNNLENLEFMKAVTLS